MAENPSKVKTTLWDKEKLLIRSNFSLFHTVFERLLLQTSKKLNVTPKLEFVSGRKDKDCGKRRKCWLPEFCPFTHYIFKKPFPKGHKGFDLYHATILSACLN